MANFLAMAALISPGDEVLVERPTYDPLLGAASFLGAKIKRFERKAGGCISPRSGQGPRGHVGPHAPDHHHQPAQSRAARSRARWSCEPSDGLRHRSALACSSTKSIWIRSAATAGARSISAPEFVATNSLTKVYGLSGLRCGWILAEPELAERMWRLNDLFGVNQAHPAERLACIAFEHHR